MTFNFAVKTAYFYTCAIHANLLPAIHYKEKIISLGQSHLDE